MMTEILHELEKNGYCYLENFLDDFTLTEVNIFIDKNKNDFAAAKVGSRENKQRIESIRGDYTFWLDPLNPREPFIGIFEFLAKLRNGVNEKFFMGLKEYECHLAYYPPGTCYHKHLDRFEMESSRRLSFIFYLNEFWDKNDGGELVIYNKAGEVLDTLLPMPGSFITFLSDEFPHEVRPSLKERRSFTGWMHTKIIY